ncbi:MAG: hypothetical protein GY795_13610 [Desulfobacterales bacterium]|nr:hypothetical protein [Desulfobacterales bacterium]
MKKNIMLLLLLSYPYSSAVAESSLLQTSDDRKLEYILNNFEIIAQKKQLPTAIKVIRVREQGECRPKLRNCPKESVYITASSFDEYPDQKLYTLRKAYKWEFNKWINAPGKGIPAGFAVFEMVKKEIIRERDKINIIEKNYEVFVNSKEAFIRLVPE